MAEKSRQEESSAELRERIARSREELGRDVAGLRYELDFPLRFRKSFQRQWPLWLTAAVAVGLVFSVLPSRRKRIYVDLKGRTLRKEKGTARLLLGVLKVGAGLLKPIVLAYAAQKMKRFASRPSVGR
jgi:hypothetical protein